MNLHISIFQTLPTTMQKKEKSMTKLRMNEVSSVKSISNEINKIVQPKNKIVKRLQDQMKCNSITDPRAGYSRMHSRHNRS
jgi:hypothetical protein